MNRHFETEQESRKMFDAPAALQRLLAREGPVMRPAVSDPMMARIAQRAGFSCVSVGGFALGAHTCVTEPLIGMSELVDESRAIQRAVEIPVTVDVGAGFGEAIQVWRTVREFELAGVAGIQMEDQVFPKRAHYHRDYREHTIDCEHMIEKITAAVEARSNPDFAIIARTDAMRTEGFAEGVRRANAYAEAGADLVMIFPNDWGETERAPKEIIAPLVYVVSHGNRVGRPVPSGQQLADTGYKVISYAILGVLAVYGAVDRAFQRLYATGEALESPEDLRALRLGVENLIGLPELYEIEERTTEKSRPTSGASVI